MSRKCARQLTLAILLAALTSLPGGSVPVSDQETKAFPAIKGDTLEVQVDSGRVRVRTWDAPEVRAVLERVSSRELQPGFRIQAGKSGRGILVHATYSGQPGESAVLDIQVPVYLEVTVSGAFVEVEVQGVDGGVSIRNISGPVSLVDVTAPTTVAVGRGDVSYRTNSQPRGAVKIETGSGNVACLVPDTVGLRASLRAGGSVYWGDEAGAPNSTITRTQGSGAVAFEAASARGDVRLAFPSRRAAAEPAPAPRPASEPPSRSTAVPPAAPQSQPPHTREPEAEAPPAGRPRLASRPAAETPPPAEAPAPKPSSVPEASSQQSPPEGVAIKVDVSNVLLNLAVVERASNRSIGGLVKEDFLVYEDGVRQEVQELLPTEAPYSLLLLMDSSGSTSSLIPLMRQAATDFIRQIKENDRVAVASFNSFATLLQDFTNDRTSAEHAIYRIQPMGGTAFYDALTTCIDQYLRRVEGRKAIVVFTDGVDNQLLGSPAQGSRTTFPELYRRVQESETLIYTIFLDSEGQYGPTGPVSRGPRQVPGRYPQPGRFPMPFPVPSPFPTPSPTPNPSPNPVPGRTGIPFPRNQQEAVAYQKAREQLEMIAEQTGGRFYSPLRAEDLAGAYAEVAEDLRSQYLLTYVSSNTSTAGWRSIKVQIRNHPGAVVRTRKGYFASKPATGSER